LLVRTRAGLCELVTIWVIPPGVDENSAGASEENPGLGGVFLPQGTFSEHMAPFGPADFSAQSGSVSALLGFNPRETSLLVL
jgi:hypothetical protein